MEFKNYLLDIIKRDKGIEKSSDICIHGINPIIKELYTEIKKYYPHTRKFLIKKLKSPRSTIDCWIDNRNPIPIKKLYKFLKIWAEVCKKSKKDIINKWDEIFKTNKGFSVSRGNKIAKLPNKLTSDISYLIGLILADGHLKSEKKLLKRDKWREYSISISGNPKEHMEYVKNLIESRFGIPCNNIRFKKDKKGSWHVLRCTSKPIFRFFSEVLGIPQGFKTGKIKVPRLIKESNLNLQKEFIAGLSDGELGVGISTKNPWLEIGQKSVNKKSPEILNWIQEILKKTKINLNGPYKMSYPGMWRLRTASQKTINMFYDKIPIKNLNKINVCKEIKRFSYEDRN